MKSLTARKLALVGFAASQWATGRISGSRHRKQYRELVAAGLALHEHGELYASAPKMRRALATIARHAAPLALVVALAGCATDPVPSSYRTADPIVKIDIRSLPPGALVYMNAEYIGTTPLELKVVATKDGSWKQPTRFQVFVPHDTGNQDIAEFPAGFRVPSRMLFRVPNYTHWYSATQQRPPQPLAVLP